MTHRSVDLPTLRRQVVVRYRAPGHVRFQLPAALCSADCGERLERALCSAGGVYRVGFQRSKGKLSIRYRESDCDFRSVAQALGAGIEQVWMELGSSRSLAVADPGEESKPASWLREKRQEMRETLQALQVMKGRVSQHAGTTPEQRERFVLEFLNDVLVLYLTKVHWNAITTQWMRNPWRHRYEWTAAFYMVYLLVRWRRSKR